MNKIYNKIGNNDFKMSIKIFELNIPNKLLMIKVIINKLHILNIIRIFKRN